MKQLMSDYLTNEEWNAIAYIFFNPNVNVDKTELNDFESTLNYMINRLIESGYKFQGIDDNGNGVQVISSDNTEKLVKLLFGVANLQEVIEWMKEGRAFLKTNLPDVLDSDTMFDLAVNFAENNGDSYIK